MQDMSYSTLSTTLFPNQAQLDIALVFLTATGSNHKPSYLCGVPETY